MSTKKQNAAVDEEQREMPDGLEEQMGYCRYCGQGKLVRTMKGWGEEQLNECATMSCTCEAAQTYQKAAERKKKAKDRVNGLFGAEAEKPLHDAVVNMLLVAVDEIEAKHIKAITIDIGHGTRAAIKKTAKENIRVERAESKKTAYEE
jgi:hypothetical protein